MHIALEGALIGLAIGLFLVATEYLLLRRSAHERAKQLRRAPELEDTERRRIASMARFSLFLPLGFAIGFWIIWG